MSRRLVPATCHGGAGRRSRKPRSGATETPGTRPSWATPVTTPPGDALGATPLSATALLFACSPARLLWRSPPPARHSPLGRRLVAATCPGVAVRRSRKPEAPWDGEAPAKTPCPRRPTPAGCPRTLPISSYAEDGKASFFSGMTILALSALTPTAYTPSPAPGAGGYVCSEESSTKKS